MTSKIISTVKSDGSVQKIIKENIAPKKTQFVYQYRDYGLYLVTPILIGIGGGIYLDKFFNTAPFFIISLLILGTVSSFYNLYKIVKDEKINDDSSRNTRRNS